MGFVACVLSDFRRTGINDINFGVDTGINRIVLNLYVYIVVVLQLCCTQYRHPILLV